MTLTTTAPFVDTSPADLTFVLNASEQPALAVSRFGPLELRILGASHQVRIGDWTETLACLTGHKAHVPDLYHEPGYEFMATTQAFTHADLTRKVQQIRDAVSGTKSLTMTFQGNPLALTAIRAESTPDTAIWETWHVYPNTGQIVTTRSIKHVRPRRPGAKPGTIAGTKARGYTLDLTNHHEKENRNP